MTFTKPVIPQFVADWIEKHKKDYDTWDRNARGDFTFRVINDLIRFDDGLRPWDFNINDDLYSWVREHEFDFVSAILYGYEIQQEQLYYVQIPNPNIIGKECLVLMRNGFKQVVAVTQIGDDWKMQEAFHLTEAEIKKDFDWAWKWAKPVTEIKQ